MKSFFTNKKGIIIFAVVALAILAVAYFAGGQTAPTNSISPQQTAPLETSENICRISIRCDDILANMSSLDPDKADFVPENGFILEPTDMTFTQGESVFDVVKRATQEKVILLDFTTTPVTYIKGIGNIYEQDCGPMSGWGFYLNGESPTMGCADIEVHPGDVIEFTYTCDFSKAFH